MHEMQMCVCEADQVQTYTPFIRWRCIETAQYAHSYLCLLRGPLRPAHLEHIIQWT